MLTITASYWSMNRGRYSHSAGLGLVRSMWQRQIHGTRLGVVLDQRQRLGVVHDHEVVVQVVADGVLAVDLLVDLPLAGRSGRSPPPCRALCIFLVMAKKSGLPWMIRHPVLMPTSFISRVSGESLAATPPP